MKVNVNNSIGSLAQVYVQGAPGIKSADGATVTFNNVADFGTGVLQPAVGIYGELRFLASPPVADVQPGKTAAGGNLYMAEPGGIYDMGTGKVSWKADGSALAYGMRTSSRISQIPATPPYGSIGEPLPVVEHAWPNLVAWGPTAATEDQYLYSSKDDLIIENIEGIYLSTVGETLTSTKLVSISAYYGAEVVYDIEWLPDASGFLFTKRYVNFEIYTDIFEYNFATKAITPLTSLLDNSARGLSISPDGQQVVFERVDDDDSTSSLWILDRDDLDVYQLINDAGRPAWGQTPAPLPPLTPSAYLPMLVW